jgi:hypothetical protein
MRAGQLYYSARNAKYKSHTVAHERQSFFFPDNGHGAANAAGFGWRNGG